MNKVMPPRLIEVSAHWESLIQPRVVGVLRSTLSRGKEIFSFTYSDDWLESTESSILDPALQLFKGVQYAPYEQENFGIFLDSSPDRWGRFLMDRREAQLARLEHREERKLLESDYLLDVYDKHRMGALRFRTDLKGDFLDNNELLASPPWASLRELEHASLELEKEDAYKNPNYSEWLKMLVVPGSSLGGARPKASVVDEKNHLWIAKFASSHDQNDMGAWEMVVHHLAKRAQLTVPESVIKKFNARHHTFMSKRFDRNGIGKRIHFASAMTLLQHSDGDDAGKGVSYLELAEFITKQGGQSLQDLEQLWRRIVFFICVSNVDDHLRNHGFILQAQGWKLSPAYDINPNSRGNGLKLNISENDNTQDLSLAISVAKYFRVNTPRSTEIIQEVVKAVKDWRREASALGISNAEQERMKPAFRIADNYKGI